MDSARGPSVRDWHQTTFTALFHQTGGRGRDLLLTKPPIARQENSKTSVFVSSYVCLTGTAC